MAGQADAWLKPMRYRLQRSFSFRGQEGRQKEGMGG